MLRPILWLKDVIPEIGGTEPLVESTVDARDFVRHSISFDLYASDGSNITISACGKFSPTPLHAEKTAVESCLKALEDHGFILPDYNYFRIKAFEGEDLASISDMV